MIRYVGGKTRHASAIAGILRLHAGEAVRYIEPFFGGGSMAKATASFPIPRFACDINEELIGLYQAIQQGWRPPAHITDAEYSAAKTMPPSPLRTYIGFACSYGGKWFGGMARDAAGTRDLTRESYQRIVRDAKYLERITFWAVPFTDLSLGQGDLVYCDPPYEGTLGYGGMFNHPDFWQRVRDWTQAGAKVFVSEYQAPPDFVSVWAKQTSVAIHNQSTDNHKVEQLWTVSG